MIIGVCGKSKSGKDTVADFLVERYGFVKVAFSDPMKRFLADVLDMSIADLWGPSELRNFPDPRYVREDGEPLSPRHALQQLGTEWGRRCCPDMWVNYAIKIAKALTAPAPATRGGFVYRQTQGLVWTELDYRADPVPGVVIPDVRFPNEAAALTAAGGLVFKVTRPGEGLTGDAARHESEQNQDDIAGNYRIDNDGSLADLEKKVAAAYSWAERANK